MDLGQAEAHPLKAVPSQKQRPTPPPNDPGQSAAFPRRPASTYLFGLGLGIVLGVTLIRSYPALWWVAFTTGAAVAALGIVLHRAGR